MKCLWCTAPTESDEASFCSYEHKVNYREAMKKPLAYLSPDSWEYEFQPLKEDENVELD